jgi:hypothetical protein
LLPQLEVYPTPTLIPTAIVTPQSPFDGGGFPIMPQP